MHSSPQKGKRLLPFIEYLNVLRERFGGLVRFLFRGFMQKKKSIIGRGDLNAGIITSVGLSIIAAPSPHPRHANVTNWPNDRATQKLRAMELAHNAVLYLRP